MRKERRLALALGLALIMGMTGCAGKESASEDALAETGVQGDDETGGGPEDGQKGEDSTNAAVIQESEWEREEPVPASGKEPEDGMVTLLEVKDAKKIPVKITEDTKVEHWIIQGGGAGIDMRDAEVSDLKEGMSVELEGYYDGETFMATRVIMEEDV
ncbi:MAG: hypothetical protein K2H37_05580 [Lachnospiraceae bacterium]|nr:hypothetical protein [Lachnospiraceae bacterium]